MSIRARMCSSRLPELLRGMLPAIAGTAYVALPIGGWGLFDGVPLGPLELFVIALIWWVWLADRRLPGARALTALLVAKAVLGGLFLEDSARMPIPCSFDADCGSHCRISVPDSVSARGIF